MKAQHLLVIALLASVGCKNDKTPKETRLTVEEPVKTVEELTKSYIGWWTYHYNEVRLSSDFLPIDEDNKQITKEAFLEKVIEGNHLVIETKTTDRKPHYKLFPFPEGLDHNFSNTIKSVTQTHLKHYKMEGKPFPSFDVVDLEGNKYNAESLKDKTTVIKTWFIACKPCVAEMPELNHMVAGYKDNPNVQFVSLALDKKEKLDKFMKKTAFDYAVVPDQEELISDKLKLNAYPTHIVIDKKGKILKVLNKAGELKSYLKFLTS